METELRRILIVDDSDEDREYLKRLLTKSAGWNWKFFEANSGEKGLALAVSCGPFECILLDYRLRDMDGLEFLEHLRAQLGKPGIATIMMAGAGDDSVAVRAMKLGAQDYLSKGNLNSSSLFRAVENAVSHFQLQESNVKLERARWAAEKANLAKSNFLSSMSHELRSPLNAILGFAQIMSSDNPPPSPSQRESIEPILHAGWHLLSLINEILDLAQIESGRLALSVKSIALGEIMLECQAMMEPQGRSRGISLAFPRFETPSFVDADRTRLKQVLINLLSNAIKYNKENGEVTVACDFSPPERSAQGRVRISVGDTGPGLSPDKVAQLFQPFNRLGQETGPQEGTGIGLALSKRLVELMGGTIGVESTPGSGSVFWFDLNLAVAPPPAPDNVRDPAFAPRQVHDDASAPAPQYNGDTMRTILYVEDNPANLKLIAQLIARRTYLRLLTATDGESGIALAHMHRPDVILMDINLPGISGIEALQSLREDPATADIPVVALSASAMPDDIEKGQLAGFFRYLTKPINIDDFSDTLDAALVRRERLAVILVVEDLPENRLLIKSYLRGSDCRLEFAENGRAALDLFSVSDFDLILMDMQMPVMNGLEASRAIRALERVRGAASPVPIVAITASATLQDIEKERMAGCNEHLSKPFSKAELLNVIAKYTPRNLRPVRPEPSRSEGSGEIGPFAAGDFARLADLGHYLRGTPQVGELRDLRELGAALETSADRMDSGSLRTQLNELGDRLGQMRFIDAALERISAWPAKPLNDDVLRRLREDSVLTELIDIFVVSAPERLAEMRRAVNASDAPGLLTSAHMLKGSCSTFGASPLGEVCARIERASGGDMEAAADLIVLAGKELNRLTGALEPYREGTPQL
jgi:CheY-like chemotaxis protein/nitrogen-specific signal transduction histidine kinase/HPt (histidine-containing phosphotransfer) domain-containing protein